MAIVDVVVSPGCGLRVYAVYKVTQQPGPDGQRHKVKATQTYGSRQTAQWALGKLQDQMADELKRDSAFLQVCEVQQ